LYEAQLSERLTYGVGPDAPGKFKSDDYSMTDTSGYVDLEWFDIALDENQYVLERSTDGANTFEVLDTLAENIESYRDTNVLRDNYYYRIKAVNDIGSSAWSNILHVDLLTLNIKSPDDHFEINVFPNPINDLLRFKATKPVEKVVLYDALGRVVKHEIVDNGIEVLIKVGNFSNGIYIMHVYFGNNRIAVKKIIKNT